MHIYVIFVIFTDNERSMYELMLKISERLITPLQLGLLRFSLSMRAQSPTIEMYNQVRTLAVIIYQSTVNVL